MKHLLSIITMLCLVGCSKVQDSPVIEDRTFTISVEKDNEYEAKLKVNTAEYIFTDRTYKRDVTIAAIETLDVSIAYVSSKTDHIILKVYEKDILKAYIDDEGELWVSISNGSIKTSNTYSPGGSGSSSGGSSSGGSGTGSSLCGAPTKDGTPCQRRVKGGGYCWQHD